MSDTPRTDAELDLRGEYLRGSIVDGAYDEIFYVMADFARQLERELAEAHRAYELARKDLLNLTEKVIPNLRAERDALKADAERYRFLRDAASSFPARDLVVTFNIGHDWIAARSAAELDDGIDAVIATRSAPNLVNATKLPKNDAEQ
jgi:hypothetical protein